MYPQLTPKQKRILDELSSYFRRRGYMPSERELAASLRLAPSTIHQHLEVLRSKGRIVTDGSARGLSLAPSPLDHLRGLSVVGEVRERTAHSKRSHGHLILPPSLHGGSAEAWKVADDSLQDRKIISGDLLLVDGSAPGPRAHRATPVVSGLNGRVVALLRLF